LSTNTQVQDSQLWAKFKELTRLQQVVVGSLFVIIPLIVVAVYQPVGIFYSNQHLYYLNGMYEAGVEYLQNDPDAAMRPTHILFTKLIYVLQKMDWLAGGSQFLSAVLLAIFGLGCILISIGIVLGWCKRQKRRPKFQDLVVGMTIAAVFAILINRTTVTHLHGMAGMHLITAYFQASTFGVFVVLGIGFMTLSHWRAATASFIIASLFHSNYLILCGPLMLIILYETYRQSKWREGVILFILYGVINLPLFIIGPLQWSQLNSAESIHFLNFVRSPHHYIVAEWWNEFEVMRVMLMALATIFAIWKLSSVLAHTMWMYFAYIVLGIAIAALTGNEAIISLLPWRAASFIIPLSQLIIVATVIIILFELTPQRIHARILFGVTALALVYWIAMKPWQWQKPYLEYTTPEIEMVIEHTQTNNVILILPEMDEAFRVYAERPIFVTWKATGYDVADWYNRILVADEMMTATIERQNELCAEYTFDYYLLPVDAPAADDVTSVANTDDYLLVACPS
jgi:hypothetical protein